jgi:Zn-finger nucleic acid-binding protein
VWFDHGEVQRLRKYEPEELWQQIAQMEGIHSMQCHGCTTPMKRGVQRCESCGWEVQLDCPSCGAAMQSAEHDGVQLDVCRSCKGVWFDRHELAEIWRMEFSQAMQRRRGGDAAYASAVLVDVLAYDPFLMFYGAHAAGHVLAAGAQAATHLPEIASAAGEAASSVFETIVELIASIFN